jgi:hypothetical protein
MKNGGTMQLPILPRKVRLLCIFVLALAGVFLLPAVSFASSLSQHDGGGTHSFALVGVTEPGSVGGVPIVGGLTFTIGDHGYYHGQLHQPTGTQLSVSGLIERHESLSLTAYSIQGIPFIKGESKYAGDGKYTGTFQVYSGNTQLASGIWSAIELDPDDVQSLTFNSIVLNGADANTATVGVLVFERETLKGHLLEPDGSQTTVKIKLSNSGKNIKISFAKGKVTATGQRATGPQVGPEKGYTGQFQGPASNDNGTWTAFQFSF